MIDKVTKDRRKFARFAEDVVIPSRYHSPASGSRSMRSHYSPERYVADHRPKGQVDERESPEDEAHRSSAAALAVADRAIEGAHARERDANFVIARERHQDVAQHARVGDRGPRDGQGEHLRAQLVVHPVEHAEVRRAQAGVQQRERERVDARVCHQDQVILANDVESAAKQSRDVQHWSYILENHHFRSPSRHVTESGSEKKICARNLRNPRTLSPSPLLSVRGRRGVSERTCTTSSLLSRGAFRHFLSPAVQREIENRGCRGS